jgi:hypothetical protein
MKNPYIKSRERRALRYLLESFRNIIIFLHYISPLAISHFKLNIYRYMGEIMFHAKKNIYIKKKLVSYNKKTNITSKGV